MSIGNKQALGSHKIFSVNVSITKIKCGGTKDFFKVCFCYIIFCAEQDLIGFWYAQLHDFRPVSLSSDTGPVITMHSTYMGETLNTDVVLFAF